MTRVGGDITEGISRYGGTDKSKTYPSGGIFGYVCSQCGRRKDDRPVTVNDWPERFCSKRCADEFIRPIGLIEQAWARLSEAQRQKVQVKP